MQGNPAPIDRALIHGRVLTVDRDFSVAEAVADRDRRLVATGRSDEIRRLADATSLVEDPGGATVRPGPRDAHNRLLSMSQVLQRVQLDDCRSIPKGLDHLTQRAAATPLGEGIIARRGDPRRHDRRRQRDRRGGDHGLDRARQARRPDRARPRLADRRR